MRPVHRADAGDRRAEIRDRVAEQAPQICGAQVRAAEREARNVPQHAGRRRGRGAGGRACRRGMRPRTIATCAGSASSRIAVRAPSGATRSTRLLTMLVIQTWPSASNARPSGYVPWPNVVNVSRGAERAVGRDAKPRQPPPERLVHVEPLAVRRQHRLVGVAQPVGDDAGTASVDEHDEAVARRRRGTRGARNLARAHGDPHAVRSSSTTKLVGGSATPSTRLEQRPHAPSRASANTPPARFTQVREQEAAVAPQRDAVGAQWTAARELRAISAAAPSGRSPRRRRASRPCRARRARREHAFRPHEPPPTKRRSSSDTRGEAAGMVWAAGVLTYAATYT